MKYLAIVSTAILVGHTLPTNSQSFEWSFLQGTWSESVEGSYGCRADNLHHTFVVSSDRKRVTFKLDRLWRIGTGDAVTEYSASVVRAAPNVLIIRYGDELKGLSDEMREWEMRFLGPGTYRWRSTAWPSGAFNQVIGVRCQ